MVRRVLVRNQRRNGDWILLFHKHRRMKQTAVEWFAEKVGHNSLISLVEYNELFEQAKAMEKEQMGKIFKQAQECAVKADGVYFKYESFEQYYNETFKSE